MLPDRILRQLLRINRNIVECKVRMESRCSRFRFCINRNIVECKVFNIMHDFSVVMTVLIETLWNVKVSADCLYLSAVPVLIETLWNVKIFPDVSEISASFGINRNIVECKAKTLGRIWICLLY